MPDPGASLNKKEEEELCLTPIVSQESAEEEKKELDQLDKSSNQFSFKTIECQEELIEFDEPKKTEMKESYHFL